ncbi:MAG: radical SAM domain-containing protein [Actinomycetota bacterium]|nr:radical SAM domain-containing protein [Actinomycetota bacterium]
MHLLRRLRRLQQLIRFGNPEFTAAMARRWKELPEVAKTPGQILGRHGVGCEGTHGVFPRCNLACAPCYHSRDANRVRVDGAHTIGEVTAQMALLRTVRGPRAHAQLIGGEVSLLAPQDHAKALTVMRAHGREPMSFTHGDFDYDYLQALAIGPDGRRRFRRLSFAAHFDQFMFGRRGIPRPANELALTDYRRRFAAMFLRLRREHGVRSFLAHNMTVTPGNVGQVADVVRTSRDMGYRMFSFQPAAHLGDERRWHETFREVTPDAVWTEIERGAGAPLDYRVLENGDVRCNRTAYGFYVGPRWYPWLDGGDARDLAVRDAFFIRMGHLSFTGTPAALLAAQVLWVLIRRPTTILLAGAWFTRTVRRVGPRALVRHRGIVPVTFVMHQFMDAAQVTPAWELTRQGQISTEPEIRATQERLAACHYAMAHPEDGTLVPACVQHAVLDPQENAALRRLLPLLPVGQRTAETG